MKSLDDLKKIRDASQKKVSMRVKSDGTRILIGMATCGIEAGARTVMNKLVEDLSNRGLDEVTVTPVGCNGKCGVEPIVEIIEGDKHTAYCNVDVKVAERIVKEHIVGGKVVQEFIFNKSKI